MLHEMALQVELARETFVAYRTSEVADALVNFADMFLEVSAVIYVSPTDRALQALETQEINLSECQVIMKIYEFIQLNKY